MTGSDVVVRDTRRRHHVGSQEADGGHLRPVSAVQDLLRRLLAAQDSRVSAHVLRGVHCQAARRRATAGIQVRSPDTTHFLTTRPNSLHICQTSPRLSPRLSLLCLLTNTLPGPSASEVTTLWRYTNLCIIIIIIIDSIIAGSFWPLELESQHNARNAPSSGGG